MPRETNHSEEVMAMREMTCARGGGKVGGDAV